MVSIAGSLFSLDDTDLAEVIPFKPREEQKELTPFVNQDIDALNGIQWALLSLLTILGIFVMKSSEITDKINERDPELSQSLKDLGISLIKTQLRLRVLLDNAAKEGK